MTGRRLSDLQWSLSYSLLFLLLLYETTIKVISVPVPLPLTVSEIEAEEDSLSLSELSASTRTMSAASSSSAAEKIGEAEKEQKHFQRKRHAIIMPVWARKAGGNWKPELLIEKQQRRIEADAHHQQHQQSAIILPKYSTVTITVGGEEEQSTKDSLQNVQTEADDAQLENSKVEEDQKPRSTEEVPVPTINFSSSSYKDHQQSPQDENKSEEMAVATKKEEVAQEDNVTDEYEYDDWGDSEEPECPEDKYYHIRGKRCVPVTCPGGNSWRDQSTGECILKRYGYRRNRWRSGRPWRP